MLPAPVNDIFGRFVVTYSIWTATSSAPSSACGRRRKTGTGRNGAGALIQCQDDVSLNRTLSRIVERFSEMRQIQLEVDTTLRKHMSDYVLTVMLVLGSIP